MPRRRLTARRVRRLRKIIAANRCDVWPGITHVWQAESHYPDWTGGLAEWVECLKCGKVELT